MSAPVYAVPDNPSDPEAAALDLIVRLPGALFRADDPESPDVPPVPVLQELSTLLSVREAFAGMTWHDAKHAAVAIISDALCRTEAAAFLLLRAERARTGRDGMTWDDAEAMARAMTIGAEVLGW